MPDPLIGNDLIMAKFSIKKWIPSAESIKSSKSLRFLGKLIDDPNLFHFNRRSVSLAFFWGIMIGLLPPIPVHTPAAALAALVSRCNLPLAIAVVWVGNPVTIPFIMFMSYHLGRFILHVEPIASLEFSWAWLSTQFGLIWKPYLVGSFVGAFAIASVSYCLTNFMWRWNVRRKWQARQEKRKLQKN